MWINAGVKTTNYTLWQWRSLQALDDLCRTYNENDTENELEG